MVPIILLKRVGKAILGHLTQGVPWSVRSCLCGPRTCARRAILGRLALKGCRFFDAAAPRLAREYTVPRTPPDTLCPCLSACVACDCGVGCLRRHMRARQVARSHQMRRAVMDMSDTLVRVSQHAQHAAHGHDDASRRGASARHTRLRRRWGWWWVPKRARASERAEGDGLRAALRRMRDGSGE